MSATAAGLGVTALVATALSQQSIGPTTTVGLGVMAFGGCLFLHRTGGAGSVSICAVLAALFMPMQTYLLGDLFVIGAVACLLIDPSRRSRAAVPRVRLIELAIVAIAVGGLIGWFFEPAVNEFGELAYYVPSAAFGLPPAVAEVGRFVVSTLGLLWFARAWRPSATDVKAIYWAYAVGSAASCVVGLIEGAEPTTGRVFGLTYHPVVFGLICAIGFALALAAAWSARTPATRVLGGVLVVINLYGVLLSGTRSALLLVILTVALLLLSTRRASVTLVVSGLFLACVSVTALAPSLIEGTSTFDRFGPDSHAEISDKNRSGLRERTIEIILERPFTGSGFTYILVPHNLVLGTIAAAGVLGMIGFGLLTYQLTHLVLRTAGRDPATAIAVAIGASYFLGSWVINVAWDRWLWFPLAIAVMRAVSTGVTPRSPDLALPHAGAGVE